ncbi:MAG: SprB repeat-containing protein [Chryseolinea sp.]
MKILFFLGSAILLSSITLMFSSCSSNDPSGPDCTSLAVVVPGANITSPTGCTANDGQLTAVGSGGVEPYQFKLGSGTYQSSPAFSNLAAGTYLVSIKDSKGCEAVSSNVVVTNLSSTLQADAEVDPDTECLSNNGEITITASGGAGSYQYKIGSGTFGSNFTFSNLGSGSYSVTVKDAENCTVVVNAVVSRGSTGISYTADILPIFQAKCQFSGCHPDNGNWFSYSTAKANASLIKSKTTAKIMPKGGSSAPGGALSEEQIKLIACWADDGAPQ